MEEEKRPETEKEEVKTETEKTQPAQAEVKKESTKETEVLKVFVIPLKKAYRKARDKRAAYAIRLIRDFIARHMKIDKGKIKIGRHLNEKVWERSAQKPPRRVKVTVTKHGDEYRAELFGFKYEEVKVSEVEEKGLAEKLASRLGAKAIKKQAEEKAVS